jgi:hypothetical protein
MDVSCQPKSSILDLSLNAITLGVQTVTAVYGFFGVSQAKMESSHAIVIQEGPPQSFVPVSGLMEEPHGPNKNMAAFISWHLPLTSVVCVRGCGCAGWDKNCAAMKVDDAAEACKGSHLVGAGGAKRALRTLGRPFYDNLLLFLMVRSEPGSGEYLAR